MRPDGWKGNIAVKLAKHGQPNVLGVTSEGRGNYFLRFPFDLKRDDYFAIIRYLVDHLLRGVADTELV